MSLNNTTERFNYIYGNTARKIEEVPYEYEFEGTSPRKRRPVTEPARKRRPKKIVKTHEAFDWRFTVMTILAVVVIFTAALFYVREISRMNHMAETVKVLRKEKTDLQSRQVSIRSELNSVVNLDSIRDYAQKELNMVYPEHDHIIYYYQDSSDYFRQYESVDKK